MRPSLAIVLMLALASCTPASDEEPVLSEADVAMSAQWFAEYEAARANGDWLGAEEKADLLRDKYGNSGAAGKLSATLADTRAHAEAVREERRLQELWDYQAVDADGGGTQRSAAIYSRTVPVEEGEIAPTADARLVLRDHPSWGRSAYLLLAQKNFDCGRPCSIGIAFDDAPASAWTGKQADSGKGPALFIVDEKKFIVALEAAKKVRITLPKGSGTIPSLVFEVDGYDPARYAKP
ncbi:hypothetical protein [Arenimonas oryziterrae]|uniref:Lipoprotein n=1 Tax=Arenimonas oryziterrae DSM 21050 = YC6267 TaxID=1121015 RepID=A0A091AZP0_9GAMM|nr:hypothetical protein [Arenimonas oryziterrae]KFN44896.1 hypothetical protein N789_02435 [Arenimonas oryziterrae DSM 21050 = YC6267]